MLTAYNRDYRETDTWLKTNTFAALANNAVAFYGACLEDDGSGTNTVQPATGYGTFAGFSQVDDITGNATGTVGVSMVVNMVVLLSFDTTNAAIGDTVYAIGDNDFQLSSTATIVGPIVEIIDSTHARVKATGGVQL